jgi:2-hydroxychromene-2-carboxylate isomerase
MANGWMFGRVICAAKQSAGEAVALPLYTAMGNRLHPGKAELSKTVIAEALDEAGLSAALLQAADDETFDETLRASTAEALKSVGDDVGTPVIAIDGVAFFGPVISPAPKGEAAGRLWDGVLNVAKTPGFFELKRTRTVDPIFD